jgi:hypothetical protein
VKKFVNSPEFAKPGAVRAYFLQNAYEFDTDCICTMMHGAVKKKVAVDDVTISEILTIWEKRSDRVRCPALTMVLQVRLAMQRPLVCSHICTGFFVV